jgi:hypothetical protein
MSFSLVIDIQKTLTRSVTPAKAGVQLVEFSGFRRSPE